MRFELGAYALMPDVRVIAPWREWDLTSREKLMPTRKSTASRSIHKKKKGPAPYSRTPTSAHLYEGGILETRTMSRRSRCGGSRVARESTAKPEYVD